MDSSRRSTSIASPNGSGDHDANSDQLDKGSNETSSSSARKRVKILENDDDTNKIQSSDSDTSEVISTCEKRPSRCQRLITGTESKANTKAISHSRKDKAPKRSAGKLVRLLDAPLDVFVEVASYLYPLDILNLSRATRGLRDLLMSKQSRLVWKAARDNLYMPNCPDDLSEPQYAHLVFSRECDACGAPKVQRVYYDLRIRLCQGCVKLNIVEGLQLAFAFDKEYIVDEDLFRLLPHDRRSLKKNSHHNPWFRHFLRPDFDDVASTYISLFFDTARRNKFVEERVERTEAAYDFALEIEDWVENNKAMKRLENETTALNRTEQILEKLRELGYNEEDFEHSFDEYRIEWDRCVNQNRALTPLIWRNIRPKLERIIQGRRKVKREVELQMRRVLRRLEIIKLYVAYWRETTSDDSADDPFLYPAFADVLCCPAAIALVEHDEARQAITEDNWQPLRDVLPEFVSKSKKEMTEKCFSVLKKDHECLSLEKVDISTDSKSDVIGEIPDTEKMESLLGLASSVFSSGEEGGLFPVFLKFNMDEKVIYDAACKPEESVWDKREIKCGPRRIEIANKLLTAMGLPFSTTFSELIALNQKFECLCCEPANRQKLNWVSLVLHFEIENLWFESSTRLLVNYESTHTYDAGNMVILDDHDIAASDLPIRCFANEASTEDAEVLLDDLDADRSCVRCDKIGMKNPLMKEREMKAHVKTKHGIEDALLYRDYELDYSADDFFAEEDLFDFFLGGMNW